MLLDGNSEVVKAVARGDAQIGLTDSDDIADGRREGLPVAALPINREMLLIPNTVAVIRAAPHPQPADRLFVYLQSPAVILSLVNANALEAATASAASEPLPVDWSKVLQDLEVTTAELNRLFLK
jgi:iron(III) transport system substrate-binding protein